MQRYADQGQAPPAALMAELNKLMEEIRREAAGEAPPPKQPTGYSSVPFTGTVTISTDVDGTVRTPEGVSITLRETATATVRVTGAREEKDERGAVTDYTPLGTVDSSAHGFWEMKAEGASITRTWEGSRQRSFGEKVNKALDLQLDPGRGKYLLHFPTGALEVPVHEVVAGHQRNYTGVVELAALPERIGSTPAEDAKTSRERTYSPGSAAIRDRYTVITYVLPLDGGPAGTFGGMRPGTDLYEIFVNEGAKPLMLVKTVTVSWHLTLEGREAKVVFEPQGYDSWLPTAGVAGAGAPLTVKVRIKEPEGAKGLITIRLADVSAQKGVCLNAPVEGETDPDLRLAPGGTGVWVSPDGREARTEDEVREVTVAVHPNDFGAFGKLEAVAAVQVKGKVEESRAVFDALGTDWLALPRDDDGNRIADSWEKTMGGTGMDAAADADEEPNSDTPGDGLSAYEEYRGAYVKGRHTRFDPRRKDLFLYDPDALARTSPLERATGLAVHYLDLFEMNITRDPARVVNFNAGLHHLVDQHGIWVHEGAAPGDLLGAALPQTGPDGKGRPNGPPRSVNPWVVVDAEKVRSGLAVYVENFRQDLAEALSGTGRAPDAAWFEEQVAARLGMTTLHEICHGLAVDHHGEDHRLSDREATAGERSGGDRDCVIRALKRCTAEGDTERWPILTGIYPWPSSLCARCRKMLTVTDLGE